MSKKNINNSNKILLPNKMFSKISILISKGVEILGWMLLILITLEMLIIMINEFANILGDLKSLFLELKAMVIASKNGYEIYGSNNGFGELFSGFIDIFSAPVKIMGKMAFAIILLALHNKIKNEVECFMKIDTSIFFDFTFNLACLLKYLFLALLAGSIFAPSIVPFGLIGGLIFFVLKSVCSRISLFILDATIKKKEVE